jgi:hypothetical protein
MGVPREQYASCQQSIIPWSCTQEVGQKALDLCSRKAGYPGLVSHWCCLLAEAHLAMEEKGSAAEALKVCGARV